MCDFNCSRQDSKGYKGSYKGYRSKGEDFGLVIHHGAMF